METTTLQVDAAWPDIIEFLAAALPMYPMNVIRRVVARGDVAVDGKRIDHSFVPEAGQTVVVTVPEEPIVVFEPTPLPLEVLHEDAHVLVVNKQAGLSVVPDPSSLECKFINGLLHYVRNESAMPCQRIHVVHRLDKGTSGALVVAKDVATARHLSERFEQRQVLKLYLGLVRGEVAEEEGDVDRAIAQHTRGRMRLRERRGRAAQSHYRVVERFRGYTLMVVQPHTGRQHQVRLHMSAIGHPLAVDKLYGGQDAIRLSEIKPGYRPKANRPETPLMDRLTLHARHLELDLADGTRLVVDAPLPDDFERLLRALRKYAAV